MYAKLKPNGQIQIAPKILKIIISNPTDERLEYEGYKKVIETEQPEYNHKTQYVQSNYIEYEDYIEQIWEVFDLPIEEIVNNNEAE